MIPATREDSSVILLDHCGTDLSVVNAARVSFNKLSDFEYFQGDPLELDGTEEWDLGYFAGGRLDGEMYARKLKLDDSKLITFLAKHKHTSPFNHAFISVRVKAPLFVARQLVKHSYMPWNEVSRRYVSYEPTFHAMKWRWKADDKKQGSAGEVSEESQMEIDRKFWHSVDTAHETYNWMLSHGVCPEQARTVLPLNANTEWVWSGTLFAFARMCNLRCKPDTQKETRVIAEDIDHLVSGLFPVAWKALRAAGV